MDSVSDKVSFSFSNVFADSDGLTEPWKIYLRIVGQFAIRVGDRILYKEEHFPLVEFAIQSQLWLERVLATGEDFVYNSQESDEPGLVWINGDDSKWRLGSVHQEYEEHSHFELEEIRAALGVYFEDLRGEALSRYKIDITDLFAWAQGSCSS